jgi:diguanylate cyclase (GGDEF)-like protein
MGTGTLRHKLEPILFFALPVLTGILFGFDRFWPWWATTPVGRFTGSILPLLAIFTSMYAITLCAMVLWYRRRNAVQERKLIEVQGRENRLLNQHQVMQGQFDILSAQREISLVLNDALDFDDILGRTLHIVYDMMHVKDADLVIWLPTEGDSFIPKVGYDGTQVHLEKKLEKMFPLEQDIRNACKHMRSFIRVEDRDYHITQPLTADREIVGVLKVRFGLVGDAEERAARAEQIEYALKEIGKVVALSVKTPDLYTKAVLDGLTGLATKRFFLQELELAFESARRHEEPLSLIMIDIDHFKSVNDTYGHLTGDIILQGVAKCLQQCMRRKSDYPYGGFRYGGEELCIILPKADSDKALVLAEKLRTKVEKKIFRGEKKEKVPITISLGISEIFPDMTDINDLMSRADEALYEAKESGRNQAVVAKQLTEKS